MHTYVCMLYKMLLIFEIFKRKYFKRFYLHKNMFVLMFFAEVNEKYRLAL